MVATKETVTKTACPFISRISFESTADRDMYVSSRMWESQIARLKYIMAKEGLILDFDNAPGYDEDSFYSDFFDGIDGVREMSDRELYLALMECLEEWENQ